MTPAQDATALADTTLLTRAQSFVDRKYVARSDERQKSMGLAYVEAERQDLAREIVNFIKAERSRATSQTPDAVPNCDCGFSAEVCKTNPCMRKKMATSGLAAP